MPPVLVVNLRLAIAGVSGHEWTPARFAGLTARKHIYLRWHLVGFAGVALDT